MSQSDETPINRRRFFGLGAKALAYVAPAVLTLAVPAFLPDEADGAEAEPGQTGGMKMMRMRMKMMRMMMM